jgi:nitrite reductase/ring-hydroxylating ferredoxin subunit
MGFKKYKWHKVADAVADIRLTAGSVGEVEVEGKKICIGRFEEGWYGFSSVCPHAGAPMMDAYIDGACRVVCPVHQLKFSLKNGRDANGEGYALKMYPVEVRPEGVFVGVEEGGLFKKWF